MSNIYYVSPSGNDANDGLSELHPWTFARLQRYQPEPGDTFRVVAGATHPGSLEWFYVGDPERPITLGRYGDSDKPNPIIASGERRGLWYGGLGGLVVQDLDFVGDGGYAAIEVTNDLDSRPARNIILERLRARGYGMAALMLNASTPISDITIRDALLVDCANGLFGSGAGDRGANMLRNLRVRNVTASDNTRANPTSQGNGICLVGFEDLELIDCRVQRNGRMDGQGHSGITLQQGDGFRVAHCVSGETLPGPVGDGQGFAFNCVRNGVTEYNRSLSDYIGFWVGSDSLLPEREWPTSGVVLRCNRAAGNVTCYQVYRAGDVHIHDNKGHTWAQGGEYRKVLDVWDAGGPVFYQRNLFRADGTALLLEAAGPGGLRNVEFVGDTWEWEAGHAGPFVVRGRAYPTLAEALAAPVPVGGAETAEPPPPVRRIVCPAPERPENVRRPAA